MCIFGLSQGGKKLVLWVHEDYGRLVVPWWSSKLPAMSLGWTRAMWEPRWRKRAREWMPKACAFQRLAIGFWGRRRIPTMEIHGLKYLLHRITYNIYHEVFIKQPLQWNGITGYFFMTRLDMDEESEDRNDMYVRCWEMRPWRWMSLAEAFTIGEGYNTIWHLFQGMHCRKQDQGRQGEGCCLPCLHQAATRTRDWHIIGLRSLI